MNKNCLDAPDSALLEDLLSDAFLASIGTVSSGRGLRRCLSRLRYVDRLRRAIACGAIREESIRKFTCELMKDFHRNVHFPHEFALAALAVALEDRKTDFVEEFLLDLARLKIVEMPLAPEVARESMKHWSKLPRSKTRIEKPFSKTACAIYLSGQFRSGEGIVVTVRNRFLAKSFRDATP